MWFAAWFFAGVFFGFFIAGLCSIAAKTEGRCIESCSDPLEREIKNIA